MLDKCANPNCNTLAHRLGHGRLHALYRCKKSARKATSIEFYWLCESCAAEWRLNFKNGKPELVSVSSSTGEHRIGTDGISPATS
jgi:hypothetical protein